MAKKNGTKTPPGPQPLALVVRSPEQSQPMEIGGVKGVVAQIQIIQDLMSQVMREGEHYGIIPGTGKRCQDCKGTGKVNDVACEKCRGMGKTGKPSLLKPGAEKLGLLFHFVPEFEGEDNVRDLGKGHREYVIKCTLRKFGTEEIVGQGVGSCSTMESKYRYRTGEVKPTGQPVPGPYWGCRESDPRKAQDMIGGKGFAVRKVDGAWQIVEQGEKVENLDPADQYNTVLKLAKKRAHVDAMLTATAASDIFTQDIEETPEPAAKEPKPADSEEAKPKAAATAEKKPTKTVSTRTVYDDIVDSLKVAPNLESLKIIWDKTATVRTALPEGQRKALVELKDATKKRFETPDLEAEQKRNALEISKIIKNTRSRAALERIAVRISDDFANKKLTSIQAQELSEQIDTRTGELTK